MLHPLPGPGSAAFDSLFFASQRARGRAGGVKVKIGVSGVLGGGREHFAVALYHPPNRLTPVSAGL